MSWKLILSIQRDTDLRLILPFGLDLRLGDVVSVQKDGGLRLEGSVKSLLGLERGASRADGAITDLTRSSGKGATWQFRAAGEASSLFPNLPSAGARFDVSFAKENGWVLALSHRALESLEEINRFRQPMLEAYDRGVWKPDWALITGIATANRMTLIASKSKNTKVTLAVNGTVSTSTPVEANLTAGVSILARNQELIQAITDEPGPVACSALRVRDRWLRRPEVGDLAKSRVEDPFEAGDGDFWEKLDDGLVPPAMLKEFENRG